jgi:phosphoenolpyruvate---glycerone phosphotransferase subunit DhaL
MSITAATVRQWLHAFAEEATERRAELTKLDTAIGDGDHGTNMDRGMRKAVEKLDAQEGDDIGALLKTVGMALVSTVGGAAGPLYGTLFLQLGTKAAGKEELDLAGWTEALDAAVTGVRARGKAEPGDKTMVDALLPALEALRAAEGEELGEALRRSAAAAEEGMRATIPMEARKGRASYLGPRSVDHQDPGATSTHMLLDTAAKAFA